MPTLRQLGYLVAIADLAHFGRAAQASHVSQPTLSQQIRALELRLGVQLVERRPGGPELTPVGRLVAERARRALIEVRDIQDLTRRAGVGAVGIIRFGVTPTLGPYLLPEIVAALHREQPDLKLHIREGIPDEQALELTRGRIDLLLAPLPLAGEQLTVEPLFSEPLHLVAPPDHPLCGRRVAGEELAGAGVLTLDERHHLHRQVAAVCAGYRMQMLRDYEGTSLDSIRQMVGSGLGLGLLPELYIASEVGGSAGVQVVTVDRWAEARSIGMAWRTNAAFEAVYRSIAARIREEAGRRMRARP